jgi:hypothetical protein
MEAHRGLARLTPGQWIVLGYLVEHGLGGLREAVVYDGTGYATSDAMLRVLRHEGLVESERDAFWLLWRPTVEGRRQAFVRSRARGLVEDVKRELEGRLTRVGLDYAGRYARRRLSLARRADERDLGLGKRDRLLIERLVDRVLDSATGCR